MGTVSVTPGAKQDKEVKMRSMTKCHCDGNMTHSAFIIIFSHSSSKAVPFRIVSEYACGLTDIFQFCKVKLETGAGCVFSGQYLQHLGSLKV